MPGWIQGYFTTDSIRIFSFHVFIASYLLLVESVRLFLFLTIALPTLIPKVLPPNVTTLIQPWTKLSNSCTRKSCSGGSSLRMMSTILILYHDVLAGLAIDDRDSPSYSSSAATSVKPIGMELESDLQEHH